MGKKSNSDQNNAALKRKLARLEEALSAARGNGLSAERLTEEQEFGEYLRLLKLFAQRYCVIVAGSDTPWGVPFDMELIGLYNDIGFRANLYGKYRLAYAAVIDAGELVFEHLEADPSKDIEKKLTLNESTVEICSIGYITREARAFEHFHGFIRVNERQMIVLTRGLNFLVYDKTTQTILDSAAFDVFEKNIPVTRRSAYTQRIKKFKEQNPNVTVISYTAPSFPKSNLTEGERFIKNNNISTGNEIILNNLDKPIFALNRYFDIDGIREVITPPESYHDHNGVRRFKDTHGRFVNTAGGHRVTEYQPKNNDDIYICGGCKVFGTGTDDKRTSSSWLQNILNQRIPQYRFIVQNYGYYLWQGDRQSDERIKIMENLPVKPGDIVICDFGEIDGIPHIDMSKAAAFPRSYEVFYDFSHYTPDGYRLIAEQLFEGLTRLGIENLIRGKDLAAPVQGGYGFGADAHAELTAYKKILREYYAEKFGMVIGAAVMNCNPFTLGHRYLIEKALEQCDFLIIFVVEEDSSDFSFDDRLRLVDLGVADIANVEVIPSGKFVLSSLTFSEYFNKSQLQDRVVDTSLDVTVFAREIAPCLHITKRFAGEEPLDSVTRQYNETMRRALPEYGIEFVEIPRKELSGRPVSASRVRALLREGRLEETRELVPESTFEYLASIFGK